MRNSLWLALLAVSISCASNDTFSSISLDYLRCPTGAVGTGTADTGASSSDSSLFGSTSTSNPNNCKNDSTICGQLGANFSCNPALGCCDEAQLNHCIRVADCTDSKNAICDFSTNNCEQCSTASDTSIGDGQCKAWAATQVNKMGQVLCFSGACVECRTKADCKNALKPICDSQDNTCKGCASPTDCSDSQICKLDTSLLAGGDTSLNLGECVKLTDVAFVDNNPTNCDSAGAGGKPFCQLAQALVTTKPYIRVTGNGTMKVYDPVTISNGKRVVIVGPLTGRDLPSDSQAVINGVTIMGGANVTLQEVVITNNTALPAAIQCNGTSTLYVKKSAVGAYPTVPNGGIYATGCTLDVEKTKIYKTLGYGISINGGSGHRVINNAIIKNGILGSEPLAMRLTGNATGLFAFNTIAGNMQGVQCDSSVAITDSIILNNGAEPQVSGSCQDIRNVHSGVTLAVGYDTMGIDPTITGSDSPCVDQGKSDSATMPTIKDDYYSHTRPKGSGYDIGFQEIR